MNISFLQASLLLEYLAQLLNRQKIHLIEKDFVLPP